MLNMNTLMVASMNHKAHFCQGLWTSRRSVRMKEDFDTATETTAKNWPMGIK